MVLSSLGGLGGQAATPAPPSTLYYDLSYSLFVMAGLTRCGPNLLFTLDCSQSQSNLVGVASHDSSVGPSVRPAMTGCNEWQIRQ